MWRPTVGRSASKTTIFPVHLLALCAFALGISACGAEASTEYGTENQEAFMAACVDPSADGVFQQRVCRCAYDEAKDSIPFERFLEIDEQLTDVDNTELPADLLDVVARCVIEEGDL